MKKIAVCIPTYNESKNIMNITLLVDNALRKYMDRYDWIIINCDNNSSDKTNDIFKSIRTISKKYSLISLKPGKGNNILNFLKYCKDNNIDYAITIDADLKSFDSSWLDKMIYSLENKMDFIIPNYYRPHYEGNTTNQLVVPVLYNLYGEFIRQPIGGDYAFNKKFINLILTKEFTKNILDYGIDIFMVITAIYNNLNICQIDYGMKVHSDSYMKMKNIFRSVVYGLCETYKQYPNNNKKNDISYDIKVLNDGMFKYRDFFETQYQKLLNNYNLDFNSYETIKNNWICCLNTFISTLPNIDNEFMNYFEDMFILRSISFWDRYNSDENWEMELIDISRKAGK